MTAETASDRQQQWALVVRRSFGIPDLVSDVDARKTLIGDLEDQLRENGWQSPAREIAEPMVDALMALGTSEDVDERMLPSGDAAYRLLKLGTKVLDPRHLAFDVTSKYPPNIIAVAQQVVDRVRQYMREQPLAN